AAEEQLAGDERALPHGGGPGFRPDPAALEDLRRVHAEAAEAGLALLESQAAPRAAETIVAGRAAAAPTRGPAATLAASWLARDLTARVLARGEDADRARWTDQPVRAPRREQLARALRVAERAARQHAAAARVAVGHIPVAARIDHQAART